MSTQTQHSLLRPLKVIPNWKEKARTVTCYSRERMTMKVADTGMENADAELQWGWLPLQTAHHSLYKNWRKMHMWTIYGWTNCTPTLTSPTNTQHLDPFHNLLCLSPGSLTGSSASRTELTFREIVYQLHSMDSLFPNPGTTSHLP
jgi:hypothetical protein